jgi:hypothetical protein
MPFGVIHVGTEFIATEHGSVLNTVRCCNCHHVYGYQLNRSEPGGAFSLFSADNAGASERATAIARLALQQSLAKDYDPVPCPECGTYQPKMLPQLRGLHRSALRTAGVFILLALGIWWAVVALLAERLDWDVPGWVKTTVLATAAPLGVGLILLRWYLGSRYDPNGQPDVERRKEIGRKRVAADAMSFAAFRADKENAVPTQKSSEGVTAVQVDRPADVDTIRLGTEPPRDIPIN